jgi:hypothetical protein
VDRGLAVGIVPPTISVKSTPALRLGNFTVIFDREIRIELETQAFGVVGVHQILATEGLLEIVLVHAFQQEGLVLFISQRKMPFPETQGGVRIELRLGHADTLSLRFGFTFGMSLRAGSRPGSLSGS